MAVFAHKIHLPLKKIHEIEKDNQARDWFWLDGYENEIKETEKKKTKSKNNHLTNTQEME